MNPLTAISAADGALNKIRELLKFSKSTQGNTSLTDITKSARVEPLVIVSQDCLNVEFLPDVMNSAQNLFIAYYLQAVAVIANIRGVAVAKTLSRLNPSAPNYVDGAKSWMYGGENYKYSLPGSKKNITLESFGLEAEKESGSSLGIINESSNLSVGKVFNVTVQSDNVKLTIPISVRLLVNSVSEKSIISMLTLMGKDASFKERWHSWRAGSISWKDMIFANDLIKESKKLLQNDKEGVISEIFQRSNNAKVYNMFNQNNLNLASASNIYVISKEVADEIERKTASKLNNFKAREQLLQSGYTMILIIVDKTWERVTFYHRGIPMGTNVGVKDIKSANKGGGSDVMDLLKAYMMGTQPTL